MLTRSRCALGAAVALLAGCGAQAADRPTDTEAGTASGPTVTVVGDTTFLELPAGRSADNGELDITFEGVTEDSRCPTGVQCVWEGNAGVRLTLVSGGTTEVFIVNSALEPRWITFVGFEIGYGNLRPYPVTEQPIDPADYTATIAIVDTR